MKKTFAAVTLSLVCITGFSENSNAVPIFYGDPDLLGTGSYTTDPITGATLEGLSAGVVTFGASPTPHSFPFAPDPGDYLGTDQIYVGSNQTGFFDGYSVSAERIEGPQIILLDYSSLVPSGETINTLTLGIGADDFETPLWGNPYIAEINGSFNADLSAVLNSLDQTGPLTQFFTIGLDTSILDSSNILTLSIDQGGNGGDGWAIDFLSVGVTTTSVPEPSSSVPEPSTIIGLGALTTFATGTRFKRKLAKAKKK